MDLTDLFAGAGFLLVLLGILPLVLFLVALWRIGSALHRIANGMREYVWLKFPGSRPPGM